MFKDKSVSEESNQQERRGLGRVPKNKNYFNAIMQWLNLLTVIKISEDYSTLLNEKISG